MQITNRRKGLKIQSWGKISFLVVMILVFSASFALGMSRRPHYVPFEDDPDRPNVLFVVGYRWLTSADREMVDYLKDKDLDVCVKKDRRVRTSDADDMDLIIISETVRARRVNSKFSDVDKPIICSEPRLYDDLGMTGSNKRYRHDDNEPNGYGYARHQNSILMANSGFDSKNLHLLAADLSAEVTVTSQPITMSWGAPGDGAEPIATLVDDSTKCAIFAYEAGKVAPGKRCGTFAFGRAANLLTSEGWDLVDATIDWALGSAVKPPTVVISAAPDFVEPRELVKLNWTITDGDSAAIDHGVGEVPVNSEWDVYPDVTTTYTITVTGPGGTTSAQVTVAVEDFFYFQQRIANPDNDIEAVELDYQMFTFTPDGSPNFYRLCRDIVTAFPTDPAGGEVLSLGDDAFVTRPLPDSPLPAEVSLFGVGYSQFHVGSNGYITFGAGDKDRSESVFDHFKIPRISGVFDDLAPNNQGVISYKPLEDRVAVTFENVTEYVQPYTNNNFQIEMFFDGTIRITYLEVDSVDGIGGLSDGNGIPANWYESNPGLYDSCILP